MGNPSRALHPLDTLLGYRPNSPCLREALTRWATRARVLEWRDGGCGVGGRRDGLKHLSFINGSGAGGAITRVQESRGLAWVDVGTDEGTPPFLYVLSFLLVKSVEYMQFLGNLEI